MRRLLVGGVTAWILLVCAGVSVQAQYDDEGLTPQQKLQRLPIIDVKGTIDAIGDDLISIKCEGQSYLLKIAPNFTRVQVNGEADRSYLRPGVLVRFEAALDKKYQAQGAIDEVCVVTPSDTAVPGIHSDADEEGEPRKPRSKQRNATDTYVVVGTIKLIKDNQLQVVADSRPLKLQLGKEPEITVEVDDYTLAAVGDEITVRGRTVQPAQGTQAGQIYGEDVTIELSKPLESTSKAPVKKKKPAKSAKAASR